MPKFIMIVLVVFILAWFFIIVPLYKSIKKMRATKVLNEELNRLATMYEHSMSTYSFPMAQTCLDRARQTVQDFNLDVRLTPQELAQIAPVVMTFPNWHTWL